jgi:hypothetical protein
LVCGQGIAPVEARIAALHALRAPTNVSQCRSLYGLFNYYRCYIEGFSSISSCISDLLKKGVVWDKDTWQQQHEAALQQLKDTLATPGLGLFRVEAGLKTVVYTDWSNTCMGAVLGQIGPDGKDRMCACISRSLNRHERNYTSYKGEMLAAVWAVKTFRPYLHGRPFTLITDHAPLKWLMTSKSLTGQYARWAMVMQKYQFEVEHRAGTQHTNADTLSRLPQDSEVDSTGARLDSTTDQAPPEPEFVDTSLGQRSYRDARMPLPSRATAPSASAAVVLLAQHSQVEQSALTALQMLGSGGAVAAAATLTSDQLMEGDMGYPHDPLLGSWHDLGVDEQAAHRHMCREMARLITLCMVWSRLSHPPLLGRGLSMSLTFPTPVMMRSRSASLT